MTLTISTFSLTAWYLLVADLQSFWLVEEVFWCLAFPDYVSAHLQLEQLVKSFCVAEIFSKNMLVQVE